MVENVFTNLERKDAENYLESTSIAMENIQELVYKLKKLGIGPNDIAFELSEAAKRLKNNQ